MRKLFIRPDFHFKTTKTHSCLWPLQFDVSQVYAHGKFLDLNNDTVDWGQMADFGLVHT